MILVEIESLFGLFDIIMLIFEFFLGHIQVLDVQHIVAHTHGIPDKKCSVWVCFVVQHLVCFTPGQHPEEPRLGKVLETKER